MTARANILLVEDEAGVALVLSDLLKAEDYAVTWASDGNRGLAAASETDFDLLILDVLLPGLNGVALCQAVRQRGFDGAILMLTAKGQIPDRVNGLRAGADDYLVKPFDPDELLARVEALLRRVHKERLTPVMRFEFGDVVADFSQQQFTKAGQPVNLAAKEAVLLRFLINNRGQVLTREQILKSVWKEQPFITERTVDVHVSWLRQKLENNPQAPEYILTARGEGYRFTRRKKTSGSEPSGA
jgi:DNA-binding response OmpR family regulator